MVKLSANPGVIHACISKTVSKDLGFHSLNAHPLVNQIRSSVVAKKGSTHVLTDPFDDHANYSGYSVKALTDR